MLDFPHEVFYSSATVFHRFSLFIGFLVLTTALSSGCAPKEPPVVYFFCDELYWNVLWEEVQLFQQLYGIQVVMIPILPHPPSDRPRAEASDQVSDPLPSTGSANSGPAGRSSRIPTPWRSRPDVNGLFSPEALVLDPKVSGLIASLADGQLYGDLYLSDSPEQKEELRRHSLISHEYPFCYLTMILLVAEGNPRQVVSAKDALNKKLRLGIVSPSRSGMGSVALNIVSKTLLPATSSPEMVEELLRESVVICKSRRELLERLESGDIDAALAWDALATETEQFASVVALPAEEHRILRQSLSSLRISDEPGYGRRLADFLISTQGRQVLSKHGFVPKPP